MLIGLAVAIAVAGGCSPESKQKLLTFFFEGVPAEGSDNKHGNKQTDGPGKKEFNLSGSVHKPYNDQQCKSCHPPDDMAGLIRKPGFCNECHRPNGAMPVRASAIVTPEKAWMHEPVGKGLCSQCHVGHQSSFPFLLLDDPAGNICIKCHDKLKEKFRGQSMDCTACHNPHFGKTKEEKLLKATPENLCLNCHQIPEKPEKNYWLHGPYATKDCGICHDKHGSPYAHQLKESSVATLCLNCHDVTEDKPHHTDLQKDCTICHNPHYASSAKDYLLKDRSSAEAMLLQGQEYALKKKLPDKNDANNAKPASDEAPQIHKR
jgi:predicted CXXCH cytochrome family protein